MRSTAKLVRFLPFHAVRADLLALGPAPAETRWIRCRLAALGS
jgi:hypothetical protein